MRRLFLLLLALLVSLTAAAAAERKGIRFWNLTLYTIVNLQLSPAGQDAWGRNQCENDRDGTVDHDERLRITDVTPGRYDVRFKDKTDRVCTVKDVEIKDGGIFAIEEKELTDCRK
jgi:hypothetical protein